MRGRCNRDARWCDCDTRRCYCVRVGAIVMRVRAISLTVVGAMSGHAARCDVTLVGAIFTPCECQRRSFVCRCQLDIRLSGRALAEPSPWSSMLVSARQNGTAMTRIETRIRGRADRHRWPDRAGGRVSEFVRVGHSIRRLYVSQPEPERAAQRPLNQRFLEAPRGPSISSAVSGPLTDDLVEDFSRNRRQDLGRRPSPVSVCGHMDWTPHAMPHTQDFRYPRGGSARLSSNRQTAPAHQRASELHEQREIHCA
jgi:hypothetical protein